MGKDYGKGDKEKISAGDAVRLVANYSVARTVKQGQQHADRTPVFGVSCEDGETGDLLRFQVKGLLHFKVAGCTAQPVDCNKGVRLSDVVAGCVTPFTGGSGRILNIRQSAAGDQFVDVLF